jgi:hypothetical protein
METIRASERASPLAFAQASPMLPEVRPHVSTALADQLEHQLDLAPHFEAGQLDVEGVAGIAVVAAAHSDGYAATGHLLGLLAALPAPGQENASGRTCGGRRAPRTCYPST